VSEHLEILRMALALGPRIVEYVSETDTLDRRLGDSSNGVRRFNAEGVEHRGQHVNRMRVVGPDFVFGLDSLGPVHDERITDPAAIGLALPAPEGRVPRKGPAPRVVIERLGAAQLIDHSEVFVQRVRNIVEEFILIDRSVRATLRAGAIVGDKHDERVIPLAELFQKGEQATIVIIRMGQESGKNLHHPGV
jgi:hypothetical protein